MDLTVFLKSIEDYDGFNEVYERASKLQTKVFDIREYLSVPEAALQVPDYTAFQHRNLLRPDYGTPKMAITRVQNIGHLFQYEDIPLLRFEMFLVLMIQ